MAFKLTYLLIVVLSLLLQACAGVSPTPAEAPKADVNVLRVAAPADDYFFNPEDPGRVSVGQGYVNANIFETLTRMDDHFQIQPLLAESWEYLEDEETWRFHLRREVTFHDGQPFTAQAVVETMNRVALGVWGNVFRIGENSTVAVDDYTLDIKPTSPDLQLPGNLTNAVLGIRAPGTDPFMGEHFGTGPFKFVEYIPGNRIIVEKNLDYWQTPAGVDRIEFYFMPDPDARITALQTQETDLIYNVPLKFAQQLSGASNIRALPSNVSAYQAVSILVTGESPYDITRDVLVREAIGYAIDRQMIIDAAFAGFAVPSNTMIPANVLGQYADRVEGYTHDPTRAATLLEEAGWQDSNNDGIRDKEGRDLRLEMVVGFPDVSANGQTPEIIQAQLREAGIELTITPVLNTTAYEERLRNKQGDLWLEIGNQNSTSPCFLPGVLYYSKETTPNPWQLAFAPGLIGWPDVDNEIDGCKATTDQVEAARHAANAMHLIIDEARTIIPLAGLYNIWLTTDQVQNFQPHPITGMVQWDTVSVTR